MRVTVTDDTVTSAVILEGPRAGEDAPDHQWRSIAEIVGDARSGDHADVAMLWPAARGYPRRVDLDPVANMIDEEYGYELQGLDLVD